MPRHSREMRSHRGWFASRSPEFRALKTVLACEFRSRPVSEFGRARPWPHKRGFLSRAKSRIYAGPTRSRAFLAGNTDRSPREDRVGAVDRKDFCAVAASLCEAHSTAESSQ